MTRLRNYWPLGLSLACLCASAYFSATDTAYVIRGCRVEDYPEVLFLFIVSPASILACALALQGARSRSGKSLAVSLALCAACVVITAGILAEPGNSICKSSVGA